MRQSGKWMVLLDDRILELISEDEQGFMSPSEIAEDGRILHSSTHVGRRCKKLAEHGLLNSVGRGVYTITSDGEKYLKGEHNAAENGNAEVSTSTRVGETQDEA